MSLKSSELNWIADKSDVYGFLFIFQTDDRLRQYLAESIARFVKLEYNTHSSHSLKGTCFIHLTVMATDYISVVS